MAAAIILVPTYLQCIHKSYYQKGMVVVVAVLINTRQCNHHNDHRRVALSECPPLGGLDGIIWEANSFPNSYYSFFKGKLHYWYKLILNR